MTMRCFAFLILLGTKISTNVEASTIDEIITNAAESASEFAFFQPVDEGKPPLVKVELDMLFTAEQWKEIQRLNRTHAAGRRYKRKAIRPDAYRWTDGIIPYKVADNGVFMLNEEKEIFKAMKEWEKYTCVTFRPASTSDRNFIFFDNGGGCFSYVGMSGGSQQVGLAKGCRVKGVIVHEVGHAVGFHHEQTRPDRDDYVEILQQNVPPNLYYNFQKYAEAVINTFAVPYDYESVMHYGTKAFSANGEDTIRTRDPKYQNTIGKINGLSFQDIKLANLMYECSKKAGCKTDIQCPKEGFLDKTCKCLCPGTTRSPVRECQGTNPRPALETTTEPVTRSPTRSTTKPEGGGCKDLSEKCPNWADLGECTKNPSHMKAYCKKSCRICDDEQSKHCIDVSDHCGFWQSEGHCTDRFASYMHSHCNKTCNTCATADGQSSNKGCEDKSVHCQYWRTMGYCEEHTLYMRSNCAKSCAMCRPDDATGEVTAQGNASPSAALSVICWLTHMTAHFVLMYIQ